MKKNSFLLAAAFSILICGNVFAQKKFTEGTIQYTMDITSGDADGMVAAMMPKEMTVKIKGTKSRSEMELGMMGTTVTITDQKTNTGTVLMDMMGNRYALNISAEDMKSQTESMPQFDIEESTEVKQIAGYKCNKAIMTNKSTKEKLTIYYTKDLPYYSNNLNAQFAQIKGMPMEFTANMQGIEMVIRVKSITAEKIADDLFSIPAGYKVTTQEEMMRDMMGGGE